MSKLLPVFILSLGLAVSGQVPQPTPPSQPRFEDTLSKSVLRITSKAVGIDGVLSGTGFLVEVPETRLEGNQVIVYLVTNRHVAKAITPDASGRNVQHKSQGWMPW
jgi:hypothetical protein